MRKTIMRKTTKTVMRLRLTAIVAVAAMALVGGFAPDARAQAARGGKAADFYVHFTNGRVMRVLNTIEQGEWTALVIDAKNHLTVPKQSIALVERISPEDKATNASSVNVMSEQPEPAYVAGPPPYRAPLSADGSDRENPDQPPLPPDPQRQEMRSIVQGQADDARSNTLFGENKNNQGTQQQMFTSPTPTGPKRKPLGSN